jgi:hypothetical protein
MHPFRYCSVIANVSMHENRNSVIERVNVDVSLSESDLIVKDKCRTNAAENQQRKSTPAELPHLPLLGVKSKGGIEPPPFGRGKEKSYANLCCSEAL